MKKCTKMSGKVAELGLLLGCGVTEVLTLVPRGVPEKGAHLYRVMAGPRLVGHADVQSGTLVFFDTDHAEVLRTRAKTGAFDFLVACHVHRRSSITSWTVNETRDCLQELFGKHRIIDAGLSGRHLLGLSDRDLKRLGCKSNEILLLRERLNNEVVAEAQQIESLKQSLCVPPPLPSEYDIVGDLNGRDSELSKTVRRMASALTVKLDKDLLNDFEKRDDGGGDGLLRHFVESAKESPALLVTNSQVNVNEVVSWFEDEKLELQGNELEELDRMSSRSPMRDSGDAAVLERTSESRPPPPSSKPVLALTMEGLTEMVLAQERRIGQLESLVATLMAQTQQQSKVSGGRRMSLTKKT
jgi:hypothetical protein